MRQRRNHATVGLAFVLACLVIAFAIFLRLKAAEPNTEAANSADNSAAPSSGNVADAELPPAGGDDNAIAASDRLAGDTAQSDRDTQEPAPALPLPNPAETATSLPLPDHQAFANACEAQQPGDPARPALCECVYQRFRSYGSVDRDKSKVAFRLCQIEAATNGDSFPRAYAPTGDDRAPTTDPSVPQ